MCDGGRWRDRGHGARLAQPRRREQKLGKGHGGGGGGGGRQGSGAGASGGVGSHVGLADALDTHAARHAGSVGVGVRGQFGVGELLWVGLELLGTWALVHCLGELLLLLGDGVCG